MLKVKDIMTKEITTVSSETGIVNAAKILLEKRINGMLVPIRPAGWVWIIYSFFSFVTLDISFKTFSRFSSSLPYSAQFPWRK